MGLIWLAGTPITFLFRNIDKRSILVFLIGFCTVSFITAAFYTRGQTSLWIFVLFAGLAVIFRNQKMPQFLRTPIPYIVMIFTPIIIFIIFCLKGFVWDAYPFFNSGRDHVYYANVSYFLAEMGKETIMYDWLPKPNAASTIPYHYTELWFNAVIARISGILHVHTFEFITVPILSILTVFTTFQLKSVSIPSWVWWIAVMGILFFSVSVFPGKGVPFYAEPKLLPLVILLLVQIELLRVRSFYLLFLSAGLYPVLNLSMLGFFPVFVLVGYIVAYQSKNLNNSLHFGVLAAFFLVICYFVFYRVTQGEFSVSLSSGMSLDFFREYYTSSAEHIKKALHFFIKYAYLAIRNYYFIWIPTLAYILFRGIGARKELSLLMLGSFGICILSGIPAAFTHPFVETGQVVLNSVFCVTFVMIIYFIKDVLSTSRLPFRVSLVGLLLVSTIVEVYGATSTKKLQGVLSPYSLNYLRDTQQKVYSDAVASRIVLRYLDPNDLKYAYELNNNIQPFGYYLYFLKDGWLIYTMNIDEINRSLMHDFPQKLHHMLYKFNFQYINVSYLEDENIGLCIHRRERELEEVKTDCDGLFKNIK